MLPVAAKAAAVSGEGPMSAADTPAETIPAKTAEESAAEQLLYPLATAIFPPGASPASAAPSLAANSGVISTPTSPDIPSSSKSSLYAVP